jgi:DnaJ-class molecular chaperone
MTDYFALLQQPRKPWLDPDELKQKYQELTLAAHPDRARSDDTGLDFATITEGYRVLRDDRLRIQHLLKLEGHAAGSGQAVPGELIDLFPEIGDFIGATDNLLERSANAQNALSKSLLRSEILQKQKLGETILQKLTQWHEEALRDLRSLNDIWANDSAKAVAQLNDLQQRLAYLTRWIEQVRERQFRLSN